MMAWTWLWRSLGIVGIVVCAVSAIARLSGHYMLGGLPVITLFEGGTTALVAACFCLLWTLTPRR